MSSMKKNQSDWDRVGRVTAAVVLTNLGIAFEGSFGLSLGIIGLFPLITGLTGWCPLCALFKRVAV